MKKVIFIVLFVWGLTALLYNSIWVPASFIFLTLMIVAARKLFGKEGIFIGGFIILSSIYLIILPTIRYEFAQSFPDLAEAVGERTDWTAFWAENKTRPGVSPQARDFLRQYSKEKRDAAETVLKWLADKPNQYNTGKITADEWRTAENEALRELHRLGIDDALVEQILGPSRPPIVTTTVTTTTLETTTSSVTTTTETTLPEPTSTIAPPLAKQNEVDSDYVKREREEMRAIADQFRATQVQVEGDSKELRRYYDLSGEVVIILNPKDQKRINFTGDKFSGKVERPVDIDGRREIEPGTKLTGKVAASGPDFWLLRLDPVKGRSGRMIHFVSSRVKRSYPRSEFSYSVWDQLAPWPTSGRKETGALVRFRIVKVQN
ncbi:MAG TPA: hypothetical protein DIV47_04955 [Candidatus Pacebacteria bacterium]|nr:hypothetical protein [Candidatus Paceibacterota bacterium]